MTNPQPAEWQDEERKAAKQYAKSSGLTGTTIKDPVATWHLGFFEGVEYMLSRMSQAIEGARKEAEIKWATAAKEELMDMFEKGRQEERARLVTLAEEMKKEYPVVQGKSTMDEWSLAHGHNSALKDFITRATNQDTK